MSIYNLVGGGVYNRVRNKAGPARKILNDKRGNSGAEVRFAYGYYTVIEHFIMGQAWIHMFAPGVFTAVGKRQAVYSYCVRMGVRHHGFYGKVQTGALDNFFHRRL